MGGGGIRSTYFILLSSNFYNVYSKDNCISIWNIKNMGHEIGLHFDEQKYKSELDLYVDDADKIELVKNAIINEANLLSEAIGCRIHTVSMHRPSKLILNANVQLPDLVNSYGKKFFEEFKYVSDSRMCWREDIEKIIQQKNYQALHILTHPIWYTEAEHNMKSCLEDLIKNSILRTYESLYDNFRDLDDVITNGEIRSRLQKFSDA